jgi:hypothetical protein
MCRYATISHWVNRKPWICRERKQVSSSYLLASADRRALLLPKGTSGLQIINIGFIVLYVQSMVSYYARLQTVVDLRLFREEKKIEAAFTHRSSTFWSDQYFFCSDQLGLHNRMEISWNGKKLAMMVHYGDSSSSTAGIGPSLATSVIVSTAMVVVVVKTRTVQRACRRGG